MHQPSTQRKRGKKVLAPGILKKACSLMQRNAQPFSSSLFNWLPSAFSHQLWTTANLWGRKQPDVSLSKFCIIFPFAVQNAKQKLKLEAEVLLRLVHVERRKREDVIGKDSEESCLGPLRELSQTGVGERSTKWGGGRGRRLETDSLPNYCTCRESLWPLGSLKGLWPTFWNVSLFIRIHS